MKNEHRHLKRTQCRVGTFGDYQVYGSQFRNDTGVSGWVIAVWPLGRSRVQTYWVENGELRGFSRATYVRGDLDRLSVETLGDAANPVPKAKNAVLRAIKKWGNGTPP